MRTTGPCDRKMCTTPVILGGLCSKPTRKSGTGIPALPVCRRKGQNSGCRGPLRSEAIGHRGTEWLPGNASFTARQSSSARKGSRLRKSTGVRGVCEVNIVLSCPYHSAQPSKLVGVTGVLTYSACSAPLRWPGGVGLCCRKGLMPILRSLRPGLMAA